MNQWCFLIKPRWNRQMTNRKIISFYKTQLQRKSNEAIQRFDESTKPVDWDFFWINGHIFCQPVSSRALWCLTLTHQEVKGGVQPILSGYERMWQKNASKLSFAFLEGPIDKFIAILLRHWSEEGAVNPDTVWVTHFLTIADDALLMNFVWMQVIVSALFDLGRPLYVNWGRKRVHC